MRFLIVQGTAREGRKSIHVSRNLRDELDSRGHSSELFDLAEKDIPMLENTRYGKGETPEDVEEYGRKVEESDCLILVTPEYNHSISGALKNLFDHLYPEYEDLPIASVTVSGGGFGGVRAQMHLENIILEVGGVPGPHLPVSNVGEVFDEKGNIKDETYRDRFENFAEDLEEVSE